MPSKQFWGVVVTAAFAIALTFTPMPDKWRLPVVVTAWIVTAFAGCAWLNEHRQTVDLSAIKKRERLDRLMLAGDVIYHQWLDKKLPKLRSKLWISSVNRFVKQHFDLAQYDTFTNHMLGFGDALAIKTEITDKKGQSLAIDIATQVDALKKLRNEIRD